MLCGEGGAGVTVAPVGLQAWLFSVRPEPARYHAEATEIEAGVKIPILKDALEQS
jgi:hypothetical protein